jgi:hypothetical protein
VPAWQHAGGILWQHDACHYHLFIYLWFVIIHCILFTYCLAPAGAANALGILRQTVPVILILFIYLICYLFLIYYFWFSVCSGSMPETSCSSRIRPIIMHYLFIIYVLFISLLFGTCSGSMREASCGSMRSAIIVYYLSTWYCSVSTAAACLRRPAAAWYRPLLYIIYNLLFIYLLLSACISSMCEASCGSIMPAIIIYYLCTPQYFPLLLYFSVFQFIDHLWLSACSSSMREASCGSMMLAIMIYYSFTT